MRRLTTWLLAASALLLACEEDAEPMEDVVLTTESERLENAGEGLYRRYCALCHGRDGEGYAADDAPALASPEWLRSASDEFIRSALEEGRPGTAMSAWSRTHGGPLNEAQIEAIVTYLRSWQRHPQVDVEQVPVVGDAGRGRVVYASECAQCHGANGEGVDAIQLRNPQLLATASDGFLQYAILHGRTGTRMPAFRDRLAPDQVNDVVAHLRSFDRRRPPAHAHPGDDRLAEIPSLDEMQLVVNPDGRQARMTLRDDRFVPSAQVKRALDEGRRVVLIDARATSDWLAGRIPGAIPMPFYEMDDVVEALPRDGTWMVAYCACPHAAS
ncbi:MAG: c-type cytochrome, partial [Sandaracinaceae bacterium]